MCLRYFLDSTSRWIFYTRIVSRLNFLMIPSVLGSWVHLFLTVLVYWKPHQSLFGTFSPLWIVLQSFWVVCFPVGRNFCLNLLPNSQAQVRHYADVVWTFSPKNLSLVGPGSFWPCFLSYIGTFLSLFPHPLKIYLPEQNITSLVQKTTTIFCRIV